MITTPALSVTSFLPTAEVFDRVDLLQNAPALNCRILVPDTAVTVSRIRCHEANECLHDREIEECEAVGHHNTASKCLSSRSPHILRRRAATKNPNDGMPEEMASDRIDMAPEVLRDHYNAQTEDDKRELQRQFLDNI